MSHFTVMVFGDDVEEQLAPYHEYECTGVDDEYVVDVDQSDEIEEFLAKVIYVGKSKETGDLDYHFNEESGAEYLDDWSPMTRAKYIEVAGLDLDEEIKDYFGVEKKEDGKFYLHTNPNAKWDWYLVGGRWSGFFKLKEGADGDVGEQSLIMKSQGVEPVESGYADSTLKGNIDLEAMMEEDRQRANKQFDHLVAAIGDIEPVSWTEFREARQANGMNMDAIRDEWRETDFQKALTAYGKKIDDPWLFALSDVYVDFYLHLPLNVARVRYVETAAANAITPFAFIKDGQWIERGEMGWWACVSNEKDKDDWQQQFVDMFNALPDDTLVTVVDCHI